MRKAIRGCLALISLVLFFLTYTLYEIRAHTSEGRYRGFGSVAFLHMGIVAVTAICVLIVAWASATHTLIGPTTQRRAVRGRRMWQPPRSS